jgi:L-ascorbate metabolism protein UlaG (beta-lactamase superfamily)
MSGARITHIGGPTVLIEVDGWTILSDPTFDAPGRLYKFGWGTSSTKTAGPAIDVAGLPPIDLVLISHDHHGDNLDDAGRALLPSAGTVVTTTRAAGRLGVAARGLDPWEATTLERTGRPSITITATPCRHGPPLSRPIVGPVVGFALEWEGQRHGVLWISGDTVLFDGVKEVANRFEVDIAILHLGEVQFPITGPIRYSMTAEDGVALCSIVKPRTAIPVHYEGWSHFHEGRADVERRIAAAPTGIRERFRLLDIGEPAEVGT